MKNRQKRIAVLMSTALAMSVLSGCAQKVEEVTEDVAIVETVSPQVGDISLNGEFIATIEPEDTVNVVSMASAEVTGVNVEVGDQVQEGDVLASLDDTAYQISLKTAQLAAKTAQLNYDIYYGEGAETLNRMNADTTLDNAEDNVEDLQEEYVGNMDELQHYKSLLKNAEDALQSNKDKYGYTDEPSEIQEYADTFKVTSSDYENAMKRYAEANVEHTKWQTKIDTYKAAIDGYEEAIEKYEDSIDKGYNSYAKAVVSDQIQNGEIREDSKQISQNTISTQNLNVENAKNTLDKCTIKASVSGTIEAVNVDEHGMASTGMTAFVISQKDVLMATFYVSEDIRNTLKVGDVTSIKKDDKEYKADIIEVGGSVDATTGLFKVKAKIEGDTSKLLNGTKVTVNADTYRESKVVMIPYDAVYYESGKPYVYTVVDGYAKKVYITTGLSDDTNIVVSDGLTTDDVIVTTWSAQLRDGVRISSPEEAAAETTTQVDEKQE